MSLSGSNIGAAKVVTTSGNQKVGGGAVLSILCSASTSMTVALYDDPATGTSVQLLAAFPLTAGQALTLNIAFAQGLNVVVTGTGTATMVVA